MILTRRRYDCNKDRKSDIDEAKRRGEEYGGEKDKFIVTRRSKVDGQRKLK